MRTLLVERLVRVTETKLNPKETAEQRYSDWFDRINGSVGEAARICQCEVIPRFLRKRSGASSRGMPSTAEEVRHVGVERGLVAEVEAVEAGEVDDEGLAEAGAKRLLGRALGPSGGRGGERTASDGDESRHGAGGLNE